MGRGRWLAMVWIGACGPSVAVDGGAGTAADTTTGDASSGVGSAATTIADATTAVPTTTVADTSSTAGTSTTEGDSSSGEFECGCPDNTPIGLGDALPDGESVAELLARFGDVTLPVNWIGYGDATSTAHLDVQYRGGAIELGPGGEDGCLFLSAPCPEGVVMEVVVGVTTDDGWLDFAVPAQLSGFGTHALVVAPTFDIADNAGTLVEQPLTVAKMPVTIGQLELVFGRSRLAASGFQGVILARVSTADCGDVCEVDDDCGSKQTCIGGLCIGGTCDVGEVIGEL